LWHLPHLFVLGSGGGKDLGATGLGSGNFWNSGNLARELEVVFVMSVCLENNAAVCNVFFVLPQFYFSKLSYVVIFVVQMACDFGAFSYFLMRILLYHGIRQQSSMLFRVFGGPL
jgi:hypothetical protein